MSTYRALPTSLPGTSRTNTAGVAVRDRGDAHQGREVAQVRSPGVLPIGVPAPVGGAVAAAIAPWWPRLDPVLLDEIAQFYQGWATHLDDSADTSDAVYRPWFDGVLEGQSGDALQSSLGASANSWRTDAVHYRTAAGAVNEAADVLRALQIELTDIIVEYEPAYEIAISEHNPNASEILTAASNAAEAAAWSAANYISSLLSGTFGTAPAGTNNGSPNAVLTSYQTGGPGYATSTSGPGESAPQAGYGQPASGEGQTLPVTGSSPVTAPTPAGSGVSPPTSSGTAPSSPAPTASGTAPSSPPSAGGPAPAPGGSGSGSGAPGVANSSAPSPTMMPPQTWAQPQPPVSARAHPRGRGDSTTGGAASDFSPLSPVDGAPGFDGGGGPNSADAGAGGMMPMPSAAAPLAPYSPPAAAALSSQQPAGTPAAPSGPPLAAGASGGLGPLIAGRRSRSASAPAPQVNPDLESARRVLAGLVKACPARPIFWAVSVLRTPVGPQTVIAGSVGGGGYLPPEVSVPSTVRLAVLDPALPSGWAAAWMGWQSPLAILVDHYERVAEAVAGVTVSALVTSELWPRRPDCGGDFLAVRHEELVTANAVPLTGGHRLTATDPALASRLTALDRGGDVSKFVAAQLTRAVWTAAAQPDGTGLPIAVKEDADILELVAAGTARREHWDNYQRDVERRDGSAVMMPEIHAPCDADDSPGSVQARLWYGHYYARGRIAEMVNCWARQPVSILDIAYCGVAAGFGAVIGAVVTELEKQIALLSGLPGGTP